MAPKIMKQDTFKHLIRKLLLEELNKDESNNKKSILRVPEMDGNGKDITKNKSKDSKIDTQNNTKIYLLDELTKLVKDIDETINVVWDDHDDLMINYRDVGFIRISPRWEDYYVIEMMTRNEDRVWLTGLNWTQVKDFVKINLKNKDKNYTSVENAYEKSVKNREDNTPSPDKGLPQKDKVKTLPLTNEPPKETKSKDKNYTEKQVKNEEDLPNQPMKPVDEIKKLSDYKVQEPVKLRKRKPDTKLKIKL